jgi:hypothetical protein
MEDNVQSPGQPAQGEPAQPAAPATPEAPQTPPQPSGQPAQTESYWQGQHDKLKAQYSSPEYQQKEQLWNLFKSRPDAATIAEEYLKANPQGAPTETPQKPTEGFDPTIDFNSEDLPNPSTPTGQYFQSQVQKVAGEIVDQRLQGLEQAQQRQAYEQHLITQKNFTPEQAKGYVDQLMNPQPDFVQKFLMGSAADAFVSVPQAPAPAEGAPAGPGQEPLPPTGGVQGAQPATKSEGDQMFDRIQAADPRGLPLKS